ncbi:hypothetical protein [Propionivibrio sp.]|uniref:putative barnase/colicin E5 family endoribonuclease n=1 Tax=Propionivibrio sp. TaxID=2212460 RepID=UPI003BF247E2
MENSLVSSMEYDSSQSEDDPVFMQFRHNAKGAIEALKKAGRGVAIAALYHPDIGDIDLRWGNTSDNPRAKGLGLAKIIKWHPEALDDLQGFIEKMTIQQRHKNEIHLRDKANGRAGIKIDWDGKTGHWLVTAFVKPGRGVHAPKGSPAALDDASGLIPATPDNVDIFILGFEMNDVNAFDSASIVGVLAKMKLIAELVANKSAIELAGTGPLAAMKKAKLVARRVEIRRILGGYPSPTPSPEPVATENADIATLRKIAAGEYDGAGMDGLQSLYGRISEAVNELNDAGLLVVGTAEDAANSAITHWAELEEKING